MLMVTNLHAAYASPIGDDVDILITLNSPELFFDDDTQTPMNFNPTVVEPGQEANFQVDTVGTTGNPDSGLTVQVDIKESQVELFFIGGTGLLDNPGDFTIDITDIDWVGESGEITSVICDPLDLTVGTVSLTSFGPHSMTFKAETEEVNMLFSFFNAQTGFTLVCPFETEHEDPKPTVPVGGEMIPIETTSLLLAGAQSFSWMIPLVLSVLGIGLFVASRKSE